MIPSSVERVPQSTCDEINEQIRQNAERQIARCASAGPQAINDRLDELDHEWDVERTLEANAATLTLIGLALGAGVNRKWYLLPTAVAGFLLLHAIEGWCPPLPVLRRLGYRTRSEIDHERYALKYVRGDFRRLPERKHEREGVNAKRVVEMMRS
ncbi:hypothetical protein Pla175_34440 [Pirellulimonas nuda]|uniref:DUF2892 domain-containing protein n=1 Tax=Pirellulimonas nuda TaxID=2528009 RepID=A0A518DEY5_9BACT|nr:DUF2892 domain-containing protein [Pirellulimonas nuda]QDU90045.1 hypothetical protein Pla175_34440 [Pirellulimonas nuda]